MLHESKVISFLFPVLIKETRSRGEAKVFLCKPKGEKLFLPQLGWCNLMCEED